MSQETDHDNARRVTAVSIVDITHCLDIVTKFVGRKEADRVGS